MGKMTKEVMDTFNDEKALKVMATVNKEGVLNNVPIMSVIAVDNETLAFAELFLNKTKENLLLTKKCCVVAFIVPQTAGVPPKGFQVKGTFEGFQTSGPIYDMLREVIEKQTGRGIKSVGIIKPDEGYMVHPGYGAYQVFGS